MYSSIRSASLIAKRGIALQAASASSRSNAIRSRCRQFSSGNPSSGSNEERTRAFYSIGVSIAERIGGEIKPLLSKEELTQVIKGFNESMEDRRSVDETTLARYSRIVSTEINDRTGQFLKLEKAKGKDFAKKYSSENPTAVETNSGLVYHELTPGLGDSPKGLESKVTVHYHGTLITGEVFDSSVLRGEPITFSLGQVIGGWQEGLQLMKPGSKAKLVIPSDLAYGDNGSAPAIRPGATLIFEVELISIEN